MLAVSFVLIVLVLGLSVKSFAQRVTAHQWYSTLTRFDGKSLSFDSYYDRYNTMLPGGVCERNFFFATYVNEKVKFNFGVYAFSGLQLNMRYFVRKLGTTAPVQTFYPVYGYEDHFNNPLTPEEFTPTTPGTYFIDFQTYDIRYGWESAQKAYFAVIPKIEKVWIEADPICGHESGSNEYHFKIKTIPDIATVMHDETIYSTGIKDAYGNCIKEQALKIGLDAEGHAPGSPFVKVWVYSNFRTTNSANIGTAVVDNNDVNGSLWSSYSGTGQNDFWMKYTDVDAKNAGLNELADFTSGTLKGAQFRVALHITDDVTLDKYLDAPILINFPATSTAPLPVNAKSEYHLENYTVTNSGAGEIWTPQDNPAQKMYGTDQSTFKIMKRLVIPPDQKLTINNMNIEFGPEGGIDVQTIPGGNALGGGVLSLNNTTLTANHACGNHDALWQGVIVYGDAAKDQLPHPIGPYGTIYYQGLLNMYNSKISYANWAITNSGPQVNSFADRNGGIINCSGSTFENNKRGVVFGIYPPSGIATRAYSSYFNNCDFTSNMPFIGFIGGWAVRGVNVSGCRFSYTGSAPAAGYNWGVYGWDFGINVKDLIPWGSTTPIHSQFNNLDYGVQMNDVSSTVSSSVKNAIFYGNRIGVSMNAVPTPIVADNSFTLPSGTAATNSLGVQINTNSGYAIYNNSFGRIPGTVYNTGVNIINTGADPNVVHSNTYTGLWGGNLSNFNNRNQNTNIYTGLQFMCNTNSNNTHDIAGRGKFRSRYTGVVDGMAGNQGSAVKAAGNSFSIGALWNIYNYTGEVLSINYYASSSQIPSSAYGTNLFPGSANDCNYAIIGGGNSGPGIDYPHLRVYYFMNDPEGIPYRDSLYLALAAWVSPYSDLTKTDLLIQDGDIANANLTYNSIVATHNLVGMEADEFSVWGRRLEDIRIALQQDNKTAQELNAAQVQDLEGIADSANMWAQTQARNWLGLYDGRQFVTEMLFPQDGQQGGNNQRSIQNTTQSPQYSIAPNPVCDALQVNYQGSVGEDVNFELRDITGKLLMSTKLEGNSGQAILDTKALAPGMYLYRISSGHTELAHGKVSKN